MKGEKGSPWSQHSVRGYRDATAAFGSVTNDRGLQMSGPSSKCPSIHSQEHAGTDENNHAKHHEDGDVANKKHASKANQNENKYMSTKHHIVDHSCSRPQSWGWPSRISC